MPIDSYYEFLSQISAEIGMPFVAAMLSVYVALVAIALPISLSVNEMARKRYKSSALLKELETISGVKPHCLNKHLFLAIATCLCICSFWGLKNDIGYYFLTAIFLIFVWSFFILYKTYSHLKATYQLVSAPLKIRNKLLASLKENRKLSCPDIKSKVSALMAIETHELTYDYEKKEIDEAIKEMLYESLDQLKDASARCFVDSMLESMAVMMAAVITTRDSSVYCNIANLYSHTLADAFSKEKDFKKYFDEHLLVAAKREFNSPKSSYPCGSGGIFLFLANQKLPSERYDAILQHFGYLARMCIEHKPDVFPSLIDNLRELILYDDDRPLSDYVWALPNEPEWSCLWGYPELDKLANKVNLFNQENFSQEIEEEFKPSLSTFLEKKSKIKSTDIPDRVKEFFSNLLEKIKRQQSIFQLKKDVLHYLAHLWCKAPTELIRCRELINPAGDKTFNVSKTPVPSSIDDCLSAFLEEKNFSNLFLFGTPLERQIVEVIAALFVYEILAPQTTGAELQCIECDLIKNALSGRTIAALREAEQRVAILDKSFAVILANQIYLEKLRLVPGQKDSLEDVIKKLISDLASVLESEIDSKLKTQKLDDDLLARFKAVIIASAKQEWSKLPLFRDIPAADAIEPFTYRWTCLRESFLARTGSSDSYESDLAKQYHDELCRKIMRHKFDSLTSLSNYLPLYGSGVLIVDYKTLFELRKIGFKFEEATRILTWPEPSKGSMLVYTLKADMPVYFTLRDDETLVKKSNSVDTDGLPIDISYEEKDRKIIHKIAFWVSEV